MTGYSEMGTNYAMVYAHEKEPKTRGMILNILHIFLTG